MIARFIAFLGVVCLPVIVRAAETAHEGGGTLPQFNVETVASQVFWLMVLFAFTYVCVKNIVLPQIGGTIDNREKHITDELQAASVLTEKARLGQSDYESKIKTARANAQTIVNEARTKVSHMFANGEASQREMFQANRDKAAEKITASKQSVLKGMDDEARKIAGDLTQKLLTSSSPKKNTKAAA